MEELARLSRRDFLKICTLVTATMGLPHSFVERVEAAVKAPKKPTVIWLNFMECTGCTETLLRSSHPPLGRFLLEIVNLEYHETVMAGAGAQAEEALNRAMKTYKGEYILVVEGAVSTKDGGIYCQIGGKPALKILKEVATDAKLVIAYGTCATFGGIQAASPNPTGAVGVSEVIGSSKLINISGCPPNPYNLLSTVAYLLTFNRPPEMDEYRRPRFAYGRRIHDHCERRPHFDEGRFAESFGDDGHRKGYCLYKLGCKGPVTYANCMTIKFCDIGAWPIGAGHPCLGCTEPHFWDRMTPFYEHLPKVTIPAGEGIVADAEKIGSYAVAGAGIAIGAHAAAGLIKRWVKGKRASETPIETEEKEG
jgi:hydrogenase small subunit/[NiFe] hydrogenase small subunit